MLGSMSPIKSLTRVDFPEPLGRRIATREESETKARPGLWWILYETTSEIAGIMSRYLQQSPSCWINIPWTLAMLPFVSSTPFG